MHSSTQVFGFVALIQPNTEFSKLFRGLDGLFFGRALALSVGRCKSGSVSIPINRGLNDHALFCLEFACPNSDWALKSYRQKCIKKGSQLSASQGHAPALRAALARAKHVEATFSVDAR